MVANQAVLTDGDDWLDQLIPYIDANHAFSATYIRDNIPLVDYRKAQGTYLAWLDVSKVVERIGAKEEAAQVWETTGRSVTPESIVQRWLAENAKVFLSPGSSYGTGGAGRMRMNVATPRSLLERGLGNIAEALARA